MHLLLTSYIHLLSSMRGNNMSVLTTDGEAVSLSDMAIAPRRREEPAVQAVDQSLEVNDGCVPSRLL